MLQRMTRKISPFLILPVLAMSAIHAAVAVPLPDSEWRKLDTKFVALAHPRQIASPGVFDRTLQHIIAIPPNGQAVDIGLPHAGKDKNGNPRPPLMARYAQEHIWIDLDNDG